MKGQRHHIVQEAYLKQWVDKSGDINTNHELNIYDIQCNSILRKSTGWDRFWRKDYNILEDEEDKYVVEKITSLIDSKAIEVIRVLDICSKKQLTYLQKSILASYVTLQFFRTPKNRDQMDAFLNEYYKNFIVEDFAKDLENNFDIDTTLSEIEDEKVKNRLVEERKTKGDKKVKHELIEFIKSEDTKFGYTESGHSKNLIKVLIGNISEKLFYSKWMFLIPPKGTKFCTSDSPCFTIKEVKDIYGESILSPNVKIIFPLSPYICLLIAPSKVKYNHEAFMKLSKKEVRDINTIILDKSYSCFMAQDINHLKNLTKNYDFKNHKKINKVISKKYNPYIYFYTI